MSDPSRERTLGSSLQNRLAAALLSSLFVVTAMGCSESTEADPAEDAGKATSVTDAGVDPPKEPDPPIVCNQLSVDGLAEGTVEWVSETAPAAVGGTLTNGTYVFVEAIVYGSTPSGPSPFMRAKLVLKDGTVERVSAETDVTSSTTEKLTPSGSTLTVATTCPEGASTQSVEYSVLSPAAAAGKETLVLYEEVDGAVTGLFYDKQK